MKKTICDIKFKRENGDQFLSVRIDPAIENLFKNDETETSEVYLDSEGEGLEFYKLSPKLEEYINKYNHSNGEGTVNLTRYGTNLFLDQYVHNLSLLRTVDISSGVEVKVNDLIVDNDVQRWIQGLAKFVKFMYSNFVEKSEVKATINLEF